MPKQAEYIRGLEEASAPVEGFQRKITTRRLRLAERAIARLKLEGKPVDDTPEQRLQRIDTENKNRWIERDEWSNGLFHDALNQIDSLPEHMRADAKAAWNASSRTASGSEFSGFIGNIKAGRSSLLKGVSHPELGAGDRLQAEAIEARRANISDRVTAGHEAFVAADKRMVDELKSLGVAPNAVGRYESLASVSSPAVRPGETEAMRQVRQIVSPQGMSESPVSTIPESGIRQIELKPVTAPVTPNVVKTTEVTPQSSATLKASSAPPMRLIEMKDAIAKHGPDKAVDAFNAQAKASGQPPLTPLELEAIPVQAERMGKPPSQQNQTVLAGQRPTAMERADIAAKLLTEKSAEIPGSPSVAGIPALAGSKLKKFQWMSEELDNRFMADATPQEKAQIARMLSSGESEPVQLALREHLKTNHPEVHGVLYPTKASGVATDISVPVSSLKAVKGNRDIGSNEQGAYDLTHGDRTVRVFRSQDDGYWYADSPGHFSDNVVGFNKKELVRDAENIVARHHAKQSAASAARLEKQAAATPSVAAKPETVNYDALNGYLANKGSIHAEASMNKFNTENGLPPLNDAEKTYLREFAKHSKGGGQLDRKAMAKAKTAAEAVVGKPASGVSAGGMVSPLYEAHGDENMVARVFKHDNGYSVSMSDKGAGKTVDQMRIFPTLDGAKEHANTIKPVAKVTDVTPEGYGPVAATAGSLPTSPLDVHLGTDAGKLRASINEANTILKGNVSGAQRSAIERTRDNAQAKLSELEKGTRAPSADEIDKPYVATSVVSPGVQEADKLAKHIVEQMGRNGLAVGHPAFAARYRDMLPVERKNLLTALVDKGLLPKTYAKTRSNFPTAYGLEQEVIGMAKAAEQAHKGVATNRHIPFTESEFYKKATGGVTQQSSAPATTITKMGGDIKVDSPSGIDDAKIGLDEMLKSRDTDGGKSIVAGRVLSAYGGNPQMQQELVKHLDDVAPGVRKYIQENHADTPKELSSLFGKTVTAKPDVADLLKEAVQYRKLGDGYNRNIANSAERLESAMQRGHGPQMLSGLADELRIRIDVHGNKASGATVESTTPTEAAYARGVKAVAKTGEKPDQAVVNVPIGKRGNLDAQIDAAKKATVEKVQRIVKPGRQQPAYEDTVLLVNGRYRVDSNAMMRGDSTDSYGKKKIYVVSNDATGELIEGGFNTRKEAVAYASRMGVDAQIDAAKKASGTIKAIENKPSPQKFSEYNLSPKTEGGWQVSDEVGGRAFGSLRNGEASITEMHSVPQDKRYTPEEGSLKSRGFFRGLIGTLKDNGAKTVRINLQSQDTRKAVARLVEKGELVNPREMTGLSVDQHPTLFDIPGTGGIKAMSAIPKGAAQEAKATPVASRKTDVASSDRLYAGPPSTEAAKKAMSDIDQIMAGRGTTEEHAVSVMQAMDRYRYEGLHDEVAAAVAHKYPEIRRLAADHTKNRKLSEDFATKISNVPDRPEPPEPNPLRDLVAMSEGGGRASANKVKVVATASDSKLDAIGLGGSWAKKMLPKFDAAKTHAERVSIYEGERKVLHPDKLDGLEKWFREKYPATSTAQTPVVSPKDEADAIWSTAAKRMQDADPAIKAQRPAEADWLTSEEAARIHELTGPKSQGAERAAAIQRLAEKKSAINPKDAGFPYDMEAARVGMDKRGYAEYGEHKVKVVPHPNGGVDDKATFAVQHLLSDGQGGANRTILPTEYKSIEEAQNAALNELGRRVSGKSAATAAPVASPEPVIPKYTRQGVKESPSDRESRRVQIADLENRLRPLEKKYSDVSSKEAKTPRGHTKIKAKLRQEADSLGTQVGELRNAQRKLTREQDLQIIEDILENPKSHEHYLKSLAEFHDQKRHHYREMTDSRQKSYALGRDGSESAIRNAENHSLESDKYSNELIDRIKAKLPADKLNKDELQSAAEDVYRDFGDKTDMNRAVEASVARRLSARKDYKNQDIDNLTFLDDAQRAALKAELTQAKEAGGPDWHTKLDPIIKKGRTANEDASNINTARVNADNEEKAKQAEITSANALKESRAKNAEVLSGPRYIESVTKRAGQLKGTVEKIIPKGPITDSMERVLEREKLSDTWEIVKEVVKGDKGKMETVFKAVHIPTGLRAVTTGSSKNAKQFLTLLSDQGIDLSKYKTADSLPRDVVNAVSRVKRTWENDDLHHLNADEKIAAMKRVERPDPGLKADMVLSADDLGVGGAKKHGVTSAKINDKLKTLAEEVPEFAYNPVLTVTDEGRLLFRNGFRYEFKPEAFNLHPSELTPGKTIGINLADMGIARASEHEVVVKSLKHAGFESVTQSKSGEIKAIKSKGDKPTIISQSKPEQWQATGVESKPVQELLDKIRWVQPGQ